MRNSKQYGVGDTKVRWCVVANQSKARIYRHTSKDNSPALVREILHPGGRLQNRELDTDAAGRAFQSSGSKKGHSMSNEESSHQHGCKRFAAEIDNFLKQGRVQNSYDELVLFAEPKFLGMLLGEMDQPTKNLLINQVRKDIVQLADHQIVQNIREVG